MQTAEFNHEDFSSQSEADKSLMVRFFYKNVENKLESQAQGRPVFLEKTYIEIRVAGQRDVQSCRPVTFADKQRFPRHFEAFEKRMEPPTEGMPLIEWPKITRTQAEELSFMNVKTVEQLASMKDSNIQQFMNGYKLKEQAVKWLETNSAETEDREKAELKAQVAELSGQVAELLKAMDKASKAAIVPKKAAKPDPEAWASGLDSDDDEAPEPAPIEGAAIPVPSAPAGVPAKRKSRRQTK